MATMVSNADKTFKVTVGNTKGVSSSQAAGVSYGYAQVEPNHLSAQRTGAIYAQLPCKSDIEVLENGLFVGLVNHKTKDRDEIVKDLINKFAEYKAEYYRMEDKAKLNAETEMDSIKREKRERACRKRQKKMIKKMDKIDNFRANTEQQWNTEKINLITKNEFNI